MPYYAMQLELTPNYDERTRLTAWCAFFGKIMHLSGGWAMAILTCSYFADPGTGDPNIVRGMHFCSWFIAGMILVFGLVPALFVRERYYAAESSKQSKESLWKSMKESSQCKPLWVLIGITFFLVFGTYSVAALGQYVNFYYIKGGQLAEASIIEGWKSTVTAVVGVLSLPFWTWVSQKLDKTKTLMLLLGLAIAGQISKIVCLDPRWPYLQLIPAIMIAGVIGAVWLLLPSMKADTADYDELYTTRRREGSINAFYSFFFKLAVTLAMFASGVMLEFTGFDVNQPAQSTEVVLRMKYVYIIVPTTIWALSLVCVCFYKLNRGRMKEIRAQLEERRGAL
jgi:GPH family glycoside/pentoside/hexuronide:cation symporter